MKASPTTYLLHYSGGRLRREGRGLSFFYWAPRSIVVAVPLASADMPFAGVIFSDGMEQDYLEFNAGATVEIRTAAAQARLVLPGAA